jgi:hypothetical protein
MCLIAIDWARIDRIYLFRNRKTWPAITNTVIFFCLYKIFAPQKETYSMHLVIWLVQLWRWIREVNEIVSVNLVHNYEELMKSPNYASGIWLMHFRRKFPVLLTHSSSIWNMQCIYNGCKCNYLLLSSNSNNYWHVLW